MKRVFIIVVAAMPALAAAAVPAQSGAMSFPERPLRYIVAFQPGGASDIIARIVADALSAELKAQVVVDNRSGASGTIGAEIAARATPDGYTLFACNIASLAVSPALYRNLGYAPGAFTPIGLIGSNANALSVYPGLPAASVPEFIALAKSQPGKLNYASAGVGTSPQLSMELFRMKVGIDIVHVPYRGITGAIVDLMAGQVHAMFSTVPSVLAVSRDGKVRVLGVTSLTRAPDLPDVPTIAESAVPGFEVISWQGLCTPAGVPEAVLGRLRAALDAVLVSPETDRRLAAQGFQLNPLKATEFAAFIQAERTKWGELVRNIGIKPQ